MKQLLIALFFSSFALAQVPTKLDQIRLDIEQSEKQVNEAYISNEALNDIKIRIEPLNEQISQATREAAEKLEEAQARLTSLAPPKPEEGKPAPPPETDAVKKERDEAAKLVSEIDAKVKQLRSYSVRSEQILQKITDHKRRMFTAQVFEHTPSLLSLNYWREVSENFPYFIRASLSLFNETKQMIGLNGLFITLFLLGLTFAFWYCVKAAIKKTNITEKLSLEDMQIERVFALFILFLEKSLPFFLSLAAGLYLLDSAGLILPRLKAVASAFIFAGGLTAILKGLCDAVIARHTSLRLLKINDDASFALVGLIRGIGRSVATAMVALALLKAIYAPLVLTVLVTQILTFMAIFRIIHFLMNKKSEDLSGLNWLRPLLWITLIVLLIASLTGFGAFASYLITRAVILCLVLLAGGLIMALIDALNTDFFLETGKYGLKLSKSLGINIDRLELLGVLISGFLRVVVVVFGFMLLLGPWGLQTGDYSARLDDSILGLRLGDLRHTIWLFLGALLVFFVGVTLTKFIKGRVAEQILPRTHMDRGLQHSLATIMSYGGFIASFFAALSFAGVSLGSVTILAGALSVGIGFGLQSIVSNFVSGLILLAERPIRVGDSINVKGEEGRVLKISIRSTEIETFERSTVIIPNSELISGTVKNWTHSNRQARVTVPIRVAYDSDIDLVMSELLAASKSVKNVQKEPPAKVYLAQLKDNGLEFELRAIITNIDHILSAKSELNIAVLKRLNAVGIIVAPPEQRVQTKKNNPDA